MFHGSPHAVQQVHNKQQVDWVHKKGTGGKIQYVEIMRRTTNGQPPLAIISTLKAMSQEKGRRARTCSNFFLELLPSTVRSGSASFSSMLGLIQCLLYIFPRTMTEHWEIPLPLPFLVSQEVLNNLKKKVFTIFMFAWLVALFFGFVLPICFVCVVCSFVGWMASLDRLSCNPG